MLTDDGKAIKSMPYFAGKIAMENLHIFILPQTGAQTGTNEDKIEI